MIKSQMEIDFGEIYVKAREKYLDGKHVNGNTGMNLDEDMCGSGGMSREEAFVFFDACGPMITNEGWMARNARTSEGREFRRVLSLASDSKKKALKRGPAFDPEGFLMKRDWYVSNFGGINQDLYEDTDAKREILKAGGYSHAWVRGGKKIRIEEAKPYVVGRMYDERLSAAEGWQEEGVVA